MDIYHGSSGGGLFNTYGQLIGITNGGSDEYVGITYAIPYTIDDTEKDKGFVNIATQLIGTATQTNYGYISGRWNIGITITSSGTENVSIVVVEQDSNAERAGIKANDIVRKIVYKKNGGTIEREIKSVSDFSSAINDMKTCLVLSDSFDMVVNRRSGFSYETHTLKVELKNQFIFCNTNK